jgi:hypothetical protein
MMVRIALLWLVTAAAVAGATDVEPENPYPDRDPYYTDEFDFLRRCAGEAAKVARFDYDRADESATQQAANAIRRTCAAELAALRNIVHPF